MTAVMLENVNHFYTFFLGKVVNHFYTFFLGDGFGVLCDFLFHFRNCLGIVLIYMIFQIIPKVDVWEFQVRPM